MNSMLPPSGTSQNRYYPRMEIEIVLAYRLLSAPEGENRVVKSRTLGIGGIMFEDDHPLPVGSIFILDLVLGETRMEVEGEVVYAIRTAPDVYQNGFSFPRLTAAQRDRLTAFFLQEYEKAPRE